MNRPVTHEPPRIVAECWTCPAAPGGTRSMRPRIVLMTEQDADDCRAAGHDVRPVAQEAEGRR